MILDFSVACRHRCRISGSHFRRNVRCCAAVGIDLGTTNSMVCAIQDGRPVVVPNSSGETSLPSVVHYGPSDIHVGTDAIRLGDIPNTFHAVKRVIGRDAEDVSKLDLGLPFKVSSDSIGHVVMNCPNAGSVSPAMVSAEILKVLKRRAEGVLAEEVDRAVITVPARFGHAQRLATMEAGMLAGIERVSLLQEPVAAALANGLGRSDAEEEAILVVDLGGGTVDVSLLQCFDGCLEIVATDGDARLGGIDLDLAILAFWLKSCGLSAEYLTQLGCVPREQLRSTAEKCKVQLSDRDAVSVPLSLHPAELPSAMEMTRHDLAAAAAPFLQKMRAPLDRLAEASHLILEPSKHLGRLCTDLEHDRYAPPPRLVTQLVLAGAGTLCPLVREYAQCCAGVPAARQVDPRCCVAVGAAIQAGIMEGNVTGALEMSDSLFSRKLHGRVSGWQL